jgi:hypothetical protein
VFVIDRTGRLVELTGWRARLLKIAIIVAAALVFTIFIVVLFGVAVTAGIVLLVAIPVAVAVGFLATVLARKQ